MGQSEDGARRAVARVLAQTYEDWDLTVTADTAIRLERRFGMPARFWLHLQADFDLQVARDAAPGAYTVSTRGGRLIATARGPSRLTDGMPVRSVVSPFAGQVGPFAKG